MGGNEFQDSFIQYREGFNANLLLKSSRMNDFETRLLNKELRTRNCEIALKEITNICNSMCQAIDNLFDNFTSTMNSLKAVLLWKSQISQIPSKLSSALNAGLNEVNHSSAPPSSDNFNCLNEIAEGKNGKRYVWMSTNLKGQRAQMSRDSNSCGYVGGTAKVSPMIRGHIISAPRIHLNRLSQDVGHRMNRAMQPTLSPINEKSPSTSPHADASPVNRDIRIPLRRLEMTNFAGKTALSEGTSNMNNVEGRSNSEEDPLEGPSWMLDRQQRSERPQSSRLSSFEYRYINFKRPNYSFNRVLNEDDRRDILNFNDDAQMGNFDMNVNGEETEGTTLPATEDVEEKSSSSNNEDISADESSTSSMDEGGKLQELAVSEEPICNRPKSGPGNLTVISGDRSSLQRVSIHKNDDSVTNMEPKPTLKLDESEKLSDSENICEVETNARPERMVSNRCSVVLSRLSCENSNSENITPKRDSKVLSERVESLRRSTRNSMNKRANGEQSNSYAERSTPYRATPKRPKRLAATLCTEKKNWLEITPVAERKLFRKQKNKTSKRK